MKCSVSGASRILHHHFLFLLLAAHVLALTCPALGQWIRSVDFGQVTFGDHLSLECTLPVLMLSFLLFNAGLGMASEELKSLFRNPQGLCFGLLANLLLPVGFALAILTFSPLWHNAHDIQNLLLGLAMIGAMPIAGSSTAWAQNANGNLALSLGLVVISTALSPVTTPLILTAFSWLTAGDAARELQTLASTGVSAFLTLAVVLPSLLGLVTRRLLGARRIERLKPGLKLCNSINLLLLIYSNAALVLPQAFTGQHWDFIALSLFTTTGLCIAAFAAGKILAQRIHASPAEQTSLMFGLGMNNNGTALVLSAMLLSTHPNVLLPIIFYNLAQQIVAGMVDKNLFSLVPFQSKEGGTFRMVKFARRQQARPVA